VAVEEEDGGLNHPNPHQRQLPAPPIYTTINSQNPYKNSSKK